MRVRTLRRRRSAAIAAVLIGMLIAFPISTAKSAPRAAEPRRRRRPGRTKPEPSIPASSSGASRRSRSTARTATATDGQGRRRRRPEPAHQAPEPDRGAHPQRAARPLPPQHHRATAAQSVGLSPPDAELHALPVRRADPEVIAYIRTLRRARLRSGEGAAGRRPSGRGRCSRSSSATSSTPARTRSTASTATRARGAAARRALPSVERCMGCHKIVAAEGNPEVKKIHELLGAQGAHPVGARLQGARARPVHAQDPRAGGRCSARRATAASRRWSGCTPRPGRASSTT